MFCQCVRFRDFLCVPGVSLAVPQGSHRGLGMAHRPRDLRVSMAALFPTSLFHLHRSAESIWHLVGLRK